MATQYAGHSKAVCGVLVLVAALCASVLTVADEPVSAMETEARYVALSPQRILDTRNATEGDYDSPWADGQTRSVQVTARGGVPAIGVESVSVHITTVNATARISWLTVTPTGDPVSTTAVLNFGTDASGHTLTNDLVIAKVGTDGQIDITNAAGNVDIVIDVVGYHTSTPADTSLQVGATLEGQAFDRLGASVALSSTGHRLAVGAPDTGNSAGSVAVFELVAGTWTQVGDDIEAGGTHQSLGESIALNADGGRVVIGAPQEESFGDKGPHVRVYEWDGASWVQMGSDINGEGDFDEFGSTVAINAAGTRFIVGGPENDAVADRSGHAQAYEWNGASWVQMGGDFDGAEDTDLAGSGVGMNASGDRVAVGARGAGTGGQVGVYEWSGTAWSQVGNKIDGADAGDQWGGYSIEMNAAGDRFLASADFNDDNGQNSSHVRVFGWDGSAWTQFGDAIPGEAAGDRAGRGKAINDTGDRIAVGSVSNDGNGDAAGHVRIFDWSGTAWAQVGVDLDGQAEGNEFGGAVALSASGDRIAGGASGAGQVRVFDIAPNPTRYSSVPPARILDSRNTTQGEYETPWAPGQTRSLQITGLAGIPASASSVVMNVTTVNATAPTSWLTVTPSGEVPSTTAVLNYGIHVATHSITNDLIVAKLSQDGSIDITNALGTVDVVIDVIGFHSPGAGDNFVSLPAARILDSRNNTQGVYDTPWATAETRSVAVAGIGGVPPSGADSVVVHITTVNATASISWLTVSPTGNPPGGTANLNFGTDPSGHTITNDIVIAKIGDNGSIDITNAFGDVDIVIDVVGYHT